MEAYQIAGAAIKVAETAFAVGTALYTFIEGVKRIPETAREFARETEALGTACQLVGKRVRLIAEEQARQLENANDSRTLLTCLKRQLKDCNRTIRQLQSAVSCVDIYKVDESNFFKRTVFQIKLSTKTDDIESARNRIRSHTSSLQLIMQSIAIDVAYVIPNRVDIQLRAHLDQIATLRLDLASLRRERHFDPEPGQRQNEATILETSDKLISCGESLYSESVAGGSIIGNPLSGKVASIHEWIKDIDAINGLPSVTSTTTTADVQPVFVGTHNPHPSLHNQSSPAVLGISEDANVVTDGNDGHSQASVDSISDNEFAIEAAQHAINNGRSAFHKQDFSEASESLREALKMVRELPTKRQTMCNSLEVRYMLGICTFHLDDAQAAEEALLNVVDNSLSSEPQHEIQRNQGLHAGHCLAQTYIKLGKLEEARSVCDSTLQGRLRIFGRTDSNYFESIALKAKITELQGNPVRAKLLANMLPVHQKQLLVEKFAHLKVSRDASLNNNETSAMTLEDLAQASDTAQSEPKTSNNSTAQARSRLVEKSAVNTAYPRFARKRESNYVRSGETFPELGAWEARVEREEAQRRSLYLDQEKVPKMKPRQDGRGARKAGEEVETASMFRRQGRPATRVAGREVGDKGREEGEEEAKKVKMLPHKEIPSRRIRFAMGGRYDERHAHVPMFGRQ